MARCRARTKNGKGRLCTRKVKKEDQRCWQHKGLPTAPPRVSNPPGARNRGGRKSSASSRARFQQWERQQRATARAERIEEKKRERVKIAADYCYDVLTDGWTAAVAQRATDYVTEQTWHRIFASRSNQCRILAKIAREILAGKDRLHDWLGSVVAWLLSLVGIEAAARQFAGELAANIPIPPIDAKVVAVTRGIQVTGILLCVARDEDVTRCQCFIDLALAETKTRVKKILVAAMSDWITLADFPPKDQHRAT